MNEKKTTLQSKGCCYSHSLNVVCSIRLKEKSILGTGSRTKGQTGFNIACQCYNYRKTLILQILCNYNYMFLLQHHGSSNQRVWSTHGWHEGQTAALWGDIPTGFYMSSFKSNVLLQLTNNASKFNTIFSFRFWWRTRQWCQTLKWNCKGSSRRMKGKIKLSLVKGNLFYNGTTQTSNYVW